MTETIRTELQAGDRVYVVNEFPTYAYEGEIRKVVAVNNIGEVQLSGGDRDWWNPRCFLRVIEPDEIIPAGASTRQVTPSGLSKLMTHWTYNRIQMPDDDMRVILSSPVSEADKLRDLISDISRDLEKAQRRLDELEGK